MNCLEKFTEYLKEHIEIILNTKTTKKTPASNAFLDKLRINTICLFIAIKSIIRMLLLNIDLTANKLENS